MSIWVFTQGDADAHIAKALSAIWARETRVYRLQTRISRGISVVPKVTTRHCRDDPYVRHARWIVTQEHPERGKADHLGTIVHLFGTPRR